MIELQVINKILLDGDLNFIRKNNITNDYFINFKTEFNFILNYYKKYGTVPTKETFIDNFPEFEFSSVRENEDYLRDKFKEEYLYNKSLPVLQKVSDLLKENSFEAFNYLKGKLPELMLGLDTEAVDLIKQADLRKDSLNNRAVLEDKNSIKTGLKELDDTLFGWMHGEELVTVFARTGEGKTWLLVWFLVNAWKQGYRVGMYSGEMSSERIGYRFDTILKHFSNNDLIKGTIINLNEYNNYINDLKNSDEKPFYIITPYDLGGRATVSQLESFIDTYHLDILGIDQYSLMKDERASRRNDTREELEHISSDLFELSIRKKIPIIALSQANRTGVRSEKDKGTPEIESIYGSDAIAQNSTKIISFRQKGTGIELSIKKNRDGRVGDTFTYSWDLDKGYIIFIDENNEQAKEDIINQYEDVEDVF